MIDALLANLETMLLYLFAACALIGAGLMLVLQQPMRVAMALISTMVYLGGVYGLLGVHFIAAFQVLIYVGAVMVFMVYAIMLLDPRDAGFTQRYSKFLIPGVIVAVLLLGVLAYVAWHETPAAAAAGTTGFGLQQFATAFLNEYWLHFELTSVLILAAVVAAIAVIRVNRGDDG